MTARYSRGGGDAAARVGGLLWGGGRVVDEKGNVMDVAIVESAGAMLDAALLEAVISWRFSPATVRGVPVSVRLTLQHLFRR